MKTKSLRTLINEKREDMTDDDVLNSSSFKNLLNKLVTYVTSSKKGFKVIFMDSTDTAFTDGVSVYCNPKGSLVKRFPKLRTRIDAIFGLIFHEAAHLLFTNFELRNSFLKELGENGKFNAYVAYKNKATMKEVREYQKKFPHIIQFYASILANITNIVEDIFIESRMKKEFPGTVKNCISLIRDAITEEMPSLKEMIDKGYRKNSIIINLILEYASCGQINKWQGLSNEYTQKIAHIEPLVDLAVNQQLAQARINFSVDIFLEIWEFIKADIDKSVEKLKNAQISESDGTEGMPNLDDLDNALAQDLLEQGQKEVNASSSDNKDVKENSTHFKGKQPTKKSSSNSSCKSSKKKGSKASGSDNEESSKENSKSITSKAGDNSSENEQNAESNSKSSKEDNKSENGESGESYSDESFPTDSETTADVSNTKTETSDESQENSCSKEETEGDGETETEADSSGENSSSDSDTQENQEDSLEKTANPADSDEDSGDEDCKDKTDSSDTDLSEPKTTEYDSEKSSDFEDLSEYEISEEELDEERSLGDTEIPRFEKNPREATDSFGDGMFDESDAENSSLDGVGQTIMNAINSIAEKKVKEDLLEAEQNSLYDEVKNTKFNDIHKNTNFRIVRHTHVGDSDIRNYNELLPLLKYSKTLQKEMERILMRENDAMLKNLYVGKKIVKSPYDRQGRIFEKKNVPNEINLAVSILVDQSGSMYGERIASAIAVSVILQDFCNAFDIPLSVSGHHSSGSYVYYDVFKDFTDIDGQDKYRLMQIDAGGCNRDGAALQFCGEHLLKRPEEKKLLILISDGQPSATGYSGEEAERDLASIKRNLKNKGVELFVAAIGEDKETLKRIYKDNFLNISDLNKMAKVMVRLVENFMDI
jgi:hypothetical protein